MAREEIRAVRRHEPADLDHDLVTVAQQDGRGIAGHLDAVAPRAHDAAKGEEAVPRQRSVPGGEERRERRRLAKPDDAGGGVRPAADARGDQHDALVREELHVHALRARFRAGLVQRGRVVARPNSDRRRYRHGVLILAVLLLAGCGGGSGGAPSVSVGAAKTYSLSQHPSAHALTLQVVQPDGTPLSRYRHGAGPHNGVHVIFVRRDLAVLLHEHPPLQPDGTFVAEEGSLPPGPYRVIVDAYPAGGPQPNFQLFGSLTVPGAYAPKALAAPTTTQVVGGYTFTLHGPPRLRAVEPALLHFTVEQNGAPAHFTPWFGALAHAIFLRAGTLDYFHTHVCAPGAVGCTSILPGGVAKVTGRSSTPGRLDVGVLVPVPGTWRLFLQCQVDGKVLTAPFTLHVR
jgi:hypothetical protein